MNNKLDSASPTVITVIHAEHCSQAICQTSQGTPHASTHLPQCFYEMYFFIKLIRKLWNKGWKLICQCLYESQRVCPQSKIMLLIELQKFILVASLQWLQSYMEVKTLEYPFFNVRSVFKWGAHCPVSLIHRIDSIAKKTIS